MAKQTFSSFWGDFSVNEENIQKVETPPKTEDDTQDPPKGGDDTPPNNTLSAQDPPQGGNPKPSQEDEPGGSDEDIDIEMSEEDAERFFNVLETEGVLDIGDDDEFESSGKGIADMVATTVRNKVAKELQNIPTQVAEFYQHVKAGGSYQDFVPQTLETDWNEIDLDNEQNQVLAMRQFLALQGLDGEEIAAEIDELVESGKIEARSRKATAALAKKQEKDKAVAEDAARERAKADAEKVQNEIDNISKFIDESEEIAGFKLDDARRQGFKDYLFKKNNRTGKTQMQSNMSDEDRRLRIAYLDYIDFNKETMEADVKTKLTRKRKKALSRHKDPNLAGGGRQSVQHKKSKNDVKKIAFPDIFGGSNIEVED